MQQSDKEWLRQALYHFPKLPLGNGFVKGWKALSCLPLPPAVRRRLAYFGSWCIEHLYSRRPISEAELNLLRANYSMLSNDAKIITLGLMMEQGYEQEARKIAQGSHRPDHINALGAVVYHKLRETGYSPPSTVPAATPWCRGLSQTARDRTRLGQRVIRA